jgi:GH35 family endo-1,4-beta-xylanase
VIESCINAGAPVDVIGIQSHMHKGYLGNDTIRDICDRFARFGKPLNWTKASLISGEIRPGMNFHSNQAPWPSTREGETRQAEEAREFHTTLFNLPAVRAITWWDFIDGQWLGAPSGLVRPDMSPKPVYKTLIRLIRHEWWFRKQAFVADASGCIRFSGPAGEYVVESDGCAKPLSLSQRTMSCDVSLPL